MLLVYPERLGRAIREEVFEQLASVINFRVCGGKFRRFIQSIYRKGTLYKKNYLWRKIEVGTLYFSAISRFTTRPIIACKHQNIVNLSSHVTLYVVSALSCKNSVVSSGIGGVVSLISDSQLNLRTHELLIRSDRHLPYDPQPYNIFTEDTHLYLIQALFIWIESPLLFYR